MTIGKGERSTSPVHVHVNEETPVHVHIKKGAASRKGAAEASNLRSSTALAKTRCRSPSPGPWIPPPGKSTRGSKPLTWQGKSGRLEIHQPRSGSGGELDTDEEDQVENKMRQYENKIDNLMTEMGTLRNEVELQKTLREVDKKDDLLEESRRILEEQEEKLGEYKDELEETERENLILRRSMERGLERVCDAEMNRAEQDRLTSEKEELMKKLVEVEIDGQAAAKQCAALKDAIRRLREEKRISPSDSALIAKQRELLMEKLADFESTNRNLRRLLREAHRKEAAGVRLIEQRDVLMRKLAETDDSNQRLRASSLDKEREMVELKAQLAAQRDENLAMASLQGSMESTRGHLQKQLRAKEADCNRLAVQVRGMESQLAQEKIEVDHLQELLGQAKEKAERDKEALKKATRVQKQRASRSEDAMEIMNSQLLEKETQLAEIQNHMDEFKARIEKLSREKNQTITDNAVLRNRISELEAMLEATDDRNKSQQDGLNMKLQHKSSEANTLRLENDRLKTELDSMKEDFKRQADELRQEGAVLQARYEQLSRSLDAANHDKQRHQLQSRRLADQINNLNSDVEKFVADSTRLKLERDQLKSELETSRSFSAAQIDALNKECAALKSKCENLKIDLEAAARGQEKERIESTCLTEQVDQLKSTVGKLRSENMDAINENQDLKHELKSEKELLKTRTEQYARDHADHEAKVDAIQTELDAAIRGMEACRLDNQQLTDNQAALTRENDNLKRDFEELRSRNCLLLGERDALQNTMTTFEQTTPATENHRELLQHVDELNQQCVVLKMHLASVTDDLNKSLERVDAKNKDTCRLTGQVDQLRLDFDKLKMKNGNLKSERKELKMALQRANDELCELRGRFTGSQSLNDSLKAEVNVAMKGFETQQTECDRLNEQLNAAKSETQKFVAENAVLIKDNERLKSSIGTIEDKLSQAELEVSTLKSSLRQYENLVEEYRVQVNKSRAESEEVIGKYEESQKEVARAQREGDIELEKVRSRLQQRLHELEPLPELLKTTELRLQDLNDKNIDYERRNIDQMRLTTELNSKVSQSAAVERSSPPPLRSRSPVWDSGYSLPPRPQSPVRDTTGGGWSSADSEMLRELMQKVDHLTKQLESLRDKWHISQDENRSLQTTLEMLERKLREADEQNRELVNALNKKEETMATNQHRLDEKSRENSCLTRQLENSLTDARRQAEQSREKASQKERQCHSRILDLEAQLSQTRGEISRIKREKEEAERRYNSRLYDLKDRLEQSHSTNRSMQNYVQFLKSSYANIFGDTTMAGSACGGATSPLRSSALN